MQLPILDGKLDVAKIPIVSLESSQRRLQIPMGGRRMPRHLRQRDGSPCAGNDIFTLGGHQKVAAGRVGAGRGIAAEGDPGAGRSAEIAEHQCLNHHGSPEILGDALTLAVETSARRSPGTEHRFDRALELQAGIVGNRPAACPAKAEDSLYCAPQLLRVGIARRRWAHHLRRKPENMGSIAATEPQPNVEGKALIATELC
jgi:hypothetical protein